MIALRRSLEERDISGQPDLGLIGVCKGALLFRMEYAAQRAGPVRREPCRTLMPNWRRIWPSGNWLNRWKPRQGHRSGCRRQHTIARGTETAELAMLRTTSGGGSPDAADLDECLVGERGPAAVDHMHGIMAPEEVRGCRRKGPHVQQPRVQGVVLGQTFVEGLSGILVLEHLRRRSG